MNSDKAHSQPQTEISNTNIKNRCPFCGPHTYCSNKQCEYRKEVKDAINKTKKTKRERKDSSISD